MNYLTVAFIAIALSINAFADVVLYDPFENGDLSTSTNGVNGGFNIIGSNGTAAEDGARGRQRSATRRMAADMES